MKYCTLAQKTWGLLSLLATLIPGLVQAEGPVCQHVLQPGQNLTKLSRTLFPNAAQSKKQWAQIIFQDNGLLDLLIQYNTQLDSIHNLRSGQIVNYPCTIEVTRPKDYYKPIVVVEGNEFTPKGKSAPSSLAYTKVLGRSGTEATPRKKSKPKLSTEEDAACSYEIQRGDSLTKLIPKIYPSAAQNKKQWAQVIYQDGGLLDVLVKHNPNLSEPSGFKVGEKIKYPCEVKVEWDSPTAVASNNLQIRTSPESLGLNHQRFRESQHACLYTVRPGDNLSRMVQRFYPKVVKTRKEWNRIIYKKDGLIDLLVRNNENVKSVDLIFPGMQIVYPCDINELDSSRNIAANPPIQAPLPTSRQTIDLSGSRFQTRGTLRHFVQSIQSYDKINRRTGTLHSNISLGAHLEISWQPNSSNQISIAYGIEQLDFAPTDQYQENDFRNILHQIGIAYQSRISRRWSLLTSLHYQQELAILALSQTRLKLERTFVPQVGVGLEYEVWGQHRWTINLGIGGRYLLPRQKGELRYRSSWKAHASPVLRYKLEKTFFELGFYGEMIFLDLNFSEQQNSQFGPQIGVGYGF